jgi:hypothetical protein
LKSNYFLRGDYQNFFQLLFILFIKIIIIIFIFHNFPSKYKNTFSQSINFITTTTIIINFTIINSNEKFLLTNDFMKLTFNSKFEKK